jgi:hypothetical protein
MVSIWFVPVCLEYYWCFFVMLIASIISVKIAQKGAWEKYDDTFVKDCFLTPLPRGGECQRAN